MGRTNESRERKAIEGYTSEEQQQILEEYLHNTRRIIREFIRLGAQFQVEYKAWKETRRRSIKALIRMVQKLDDLEEQIQAADCAGGVFGVTGGCLTLTGIILAPFTAGLSAVLATSGLSVQGLSCLFSLNMLFAKICGTRRYTKGAKALLSEDREKTERLAALCKALVATHEELVESAELANKLIEEFGANCQHHRFTIWPNVRTLDVLFNTGEAAGSFNVFTVELLIQVGLLDHAAHGVEQVVKTGTQGAKVAMEGVAIAAAGKGASSAIRGTSTGRALLKEVGAKKSTVTAKVIAKDITSETARSVVVIEDATTLAGAGSGCLGKTLAHRPASTVTTTSSSLYSTMEVVGVGLTLCGVGLSLISAALAGGKIYRGCVSEVGEIIKQIIHDLIENRNNFIKFYADNIWLDETDILVPFGQS